MPTDPNEPREGQISTDPDTVRNWAETADAVPVESQSGEVEVLPEERVEETHERIDWERLMTEIDDRDEVLVYYGEEQTTPFEILNREAAVDQTDLTREEIEERLLAGETVTSTVRETTVVESVVVEEATVESELVDSEVVEQNMLDADLIRRDCTSCEVDIAQETGEEWFDAGRYFHSLDWTTPGGEGTVAETGTDEETLGGTENQRAPMAGDSRTGAEEREMTVEEEFPYHAVLELEEAWTVTWQLSERFTVESRIAHTDVSGSDTVETQDIDVEGLQRAIAEEGLLDIDLSPDEVLTQCDIKTEFTEGDRAQTYFTRRQVFEDEVVDRKRLEAEVTGGELLEMEKTSERMIGAEFTDDEDLEPTATAGQDPTEATDEQRQAATADEETGQAGEETLGPAGEADEQQPSAASEGAAVELSSDDLGSTVVDAEGEEIGTVEEIDETGDVLFVDPHQSLTERIKSTLDWGDADDESYSLHSNQIASTTEDEVRLKHEEDLNP